MARDSNFFTHFYALLKQWGRRAAANPDESDLKSCNGVPSDSIELRAGLALWALAIVAPAVVASGR
jgi:hypothetical protein